MRFSLKTFLLVTIIIALGVALWVTNRSVRPLQRELALAGEELALAREQIADLQEQLGVFPEVDPHQIQAMRVVPPLRDLRRYRVFLPSDKQYYLHIAVGHIPVHGLPTSDEDRDGHVRFPNISSISNTLRSGEFTIDVEAVNVGNSWKLRVSTLGENRGHDELNLSPFDEWFDDRRAWSIHGVGQKVVKQPKDRPLIVYSLHRGILRESEGGYSLSSPQGTADGVIVWIDEEEM